MAVRVSGEPTFPGEDRETLFSTQGYLEGNGWPQYDVAARVDPQNVVSKRSRKAHRASSTVAWTIVRAAAPT
jgi:hypothetical protein